MPKISHAAFIKALSLSVFCSTVVGSTLYTQNFETSVATNQTIGSANTTTIGWRGYVNATADGTINNLIFVCPGIGNPNTSKGYLAFVPNAKPQLMAAVTTFTAPLDVSVATITWTMGNHQPTVSEVRLLIRIGRSWYASSRVYQNGDFTASAFSDANTGAVLQTMKFSASRSDWCSFTLDPDKQVMALGPVIATDLPSAKISGVGFSVNNNSVYTDNSNVVRIDTLAITPAKPR